MKTFPYRYMCIDTHAAGKAFTAFAFELFLFFLFLDAFAQKNLILAVDHGQNEIKAAVELIFIQILQIAGLFQKSLHIVYTVDEGFFQGVCGFGFHRGFSLHGSCSGSAGKLIKAAILDKGAVLYMIKEIIADALLNGFVHF